MTKRKLCKIKVLTNFAFKQSVSDLIFLKRNFVFLKSSKSKNFTNFLIISTCDSSGSSLKKQTK